MSLANRSSPVEVEQVLGRILRRPYARQWKEEFLNLCYVFTASEDFRQTLENIVAGLNEAGFTEKEYRVAGADAETSGQMRQTGMDFGLAGVDGSINTVVPTMAVTSITPPIENPVGGEGYANVPTGIDKEVQSMLGAAHASNEAYMQGEQTSGVAPEVEEKMNHFRVKPEFESALELALPQFFITKKRPDFSVCKRKNAC